MRLKPILATAACVLAACAKDTSPHVAPVLGLTASPWRVPADGVATALVTPGADAVGPMTFMTTLGTFTAPDGTTGKKITLAQPTAVLLASPCDARAVAGCLGRASVGAVDARQATGMTAVEFVCPTGATCLGGSGGGGGGGGIGGGGSGTATFLEHLGASGTSVEPRSIAAADDGSVALLADANGALNVGCAAQPAAGFVVHYAADATCDWMKDFGASVPRTDYSASRPLKSQAIIAPAPGGGVFLAAELIADLDLGSGPIAGPAVAGKLVTLVAKLDAAGNVIWAKSSQPPATGNSGFLQALGSDPTSGDVVAAGYGTVDFGTGPTDTTSAWVARFGGDDGTPRWVAAFHATDVEWVLFSPAGDPVVVFLTVNADFGTGTLTGNTALVRLAGTTGAQISVATLGPWFDAVGMSADGDVLVTGVYDGSVDVGGITVTTASSLQQSFIGKVSVLGEGRWAYGVQNGDSDHAVGMQFASSANADYVAGSYLGSPAFGGGLGLTSTYAWNGFVATLTPADGTATGAHTYPAGASGGAWDLGTWQNTFAYAGSTVALAAGVTGEHTVGTNTVVTARGTRDTVILRDTPP